MCWMGVAMGWDFIAKSKAAIDAEIILRYFGAWRLWMSVYPYSAKRIEDRELFTVEGKVGQSCVLLRLEIVERRLDQLPSSLPFSYRYNITPTSLHHNITTSQPHSS